MHLTNYAVNKNSDDYESGGEEDAGHKRYLHHIFNHIKEHYGETVNVWERIKDLICKTLITVQPSLAHQYMSCRPHDFENSSCFEILGFDVMIDYKLRPWLLEVNHSPSFNTDSDLDKDVKMTVIGDTIKLLNLTSQRKESYKKQRTELLNSRMMGTNKKISIESKKQLMGVHDKERDKYES